MDDMKMEDIEKALVSLREAFGAMSNGKASGLMGHQLIRLPTSSGN